MLQPFEPFAPEMITQLLKLHERFLVSQTYNYRSAQHITNLLFSPYAEERLAIVHYKAVRADKYAAVLDLSSTKHVERLQVILKPESSYGCYFSVVRNIKALETKVKATYDHKIRNYIERHTNWRLNNSMTVNASVQMVFGELFILLKHPGQTLRIQLKELDLY